MNRILSFCSIFVCLFIYSNLSAQYYTPSRGEEGIAMFYADYLHGQSTALGEIYSKEELTASHPYHPKGTLLKVTRKDNGRSVTVRVNDRGTFQNGVIIDLSFAAAMEIDLLKNGKAWVSVEQVGYSETNPPNPNRARAVTAAPTSSYGNDQFTTKGIGAPATTYTARGGYSGPSPSGALGGYAVQVGAYSVYDNALRRQESLTKQGVSGVLIKENVQAGGASLFRVLIGSFSTRTAAETYLSDYLKASYLADGVVVQAGQ
ncbi:MAG: septal ring lytic transglycosylase RlpA family protein [Saprospiraceae bacterium]|nr:septal ring lytic transglycosylase RlpA family protein [Saprospiraceae bacterium]